MAAGLVVNTNGNPWLLTWNASSGLALPATVVGVQPTGNQAFPIYPKRIVVQFGDSAAAGNKVILKDVPGVGGTATAREIAPPFIATGADFEPPQEWKAGSKEAGFVGLQVTEFDDASCVVAIYH